MQKPAAIALALTGAAAASALAFGLVSGSPDFPSAARAAETSSAAPTTQPAPTTSAPRTTAPRVTPQPTVADITERAFLETAHERGLDAYAFAEGARDQATADQFLIDVANTVLCDGFRDGLSFSEAVFVLQDPTQLGMTRADSEYYIGLAIAAYCPDAGHVIP